MNYEYDVGTMKIHRNGDITIDFGGEDLEVRMPQDGIELLIEALQKSLKQARELCPQPPSNLPNKRMPPGKEQEN